MRSRARTSRHESLRERITEEAARILAEEGVSDYQMAKRKAAARLNESETRDLPSNGEVEAALATRLALFHGDTRTRLLGMMRRAALELMSRLERFDPRVAGALVSGNATQATPVEIHVAADTPEEVRFFLDDAGIPVEDMQRNLRFGGDRRVAVPGFRLFAGDARVEILVFSRAAMREPPLSPVDGRPLQRLGYAEVERLLV
jgi:hypothetical protein